MERDLATAQTTREASTACERTRGGRCYRPNIDIIEGAEELTLVADLPGATSEAIDVRFEDGKLAIYGSVKAREPNGARLLLQEYGVGDFHRSFEVSEAIDPDKISADFQNGVLTLHLPKSAAARPRKITVKQA